MTSRGQIAAPVVRFAPSPTGFLHIGGVRTALFNWLYARKNGGTFLLRIEDTDQARSSLAAIDAIIKGLEWMGINWDGDVVFQSQNIGTHIAAVETLLDRGHAYKCYATPEEIAEWRQHQEQQGTHKPFQSPYRDQPGQENDTRPFSVRLRAPQTGSTIFHDHVQGEMCFDNAELDDFVLLRSDGTPTYMLSVVVDDYNMGITHIIRGVDHLTNAARQILLFQALGYPVPEFAHIPLIHGSDGAKLSKRHGALGVESYSAQGYLPDAMINALARLGWSHGDMEFFPVDALQACFDLADINKAPARLDFDKLDAINVWHMGQLDDDELIARIEDFYLDNFPEDSPERRDMTQLAYDHRDALCALLPHMRERAVRLGDFLQHAQFVLDQSTTPHIPEDVRHKLDPRVIDTVQNLVQALADLEVWNQEHIQSAVETYLAANALKMKHVGPLLRIAGTGHMGVLPLFVSFSVLDQSLVVGRLRHI